MGVANAIAGLRKWEPQIIYSHGLIDPRIEALTTMVAPALIFLHTYRGTCISGRKAFAFPVVRPCQRRFGFGCLTRFYPLRCGGLNPLTMLQDYRLQHRRLLMLHSYSFLLTASEYMRAEYVNHGLDPEKVRCVNLPLASSNEAQLEVEASGQRPKKALSRLVFVGRIEELKGGRVLIDAVHRAAVSLRRRLELTFVGDGRQRAIWERTCQKMQSSGVVEVRFLGWLERAALSQALLSSDLLVMPSLWPEPFGLSGIEAAAFGIPAVAFNVGVVSEWLTDGVNGCLAAGNPPTAEGLAKAIIACLLDPIVYERLCAGARNQALRFSMERHVRELFGIFKLVRRGLNQ
jgi:glycosyltransferase involved in cell wall biosynthesis